MPKGNLSPEAEQRRREQRRRYPDNWGDIRWRILGIANYRCEFCGVRQGEPHPLTGKEVTLQIAHMNHTPEDCRDENLRALCPVCHGRNDGAHRAEVARQARIVRMKEASRLKRMEQTRAAVAKAHAGRGRMKDALVIRLRDRAKLMLLAEIREAGGEKAFDVNWRSDRLIQLLDELTEEARLELVSKDSKAAIYRITSNIRQAARLPLNAPSGEFPGQTP